MLKFLLVVILVAVAVYLIVRAIQRRGVSPTQKQQPPSRPFGPDDDPDFLRDLDWRRRHPHDPEA